MPWLFRLCRLHHLIHRNLTPDSCRKLILIYLFPVCPLFAILEVALFINHISVNWQSGNDPEAPSFTAASKIDDTTQRLYPVVYAFYTACIPLAIIFAVLSVVSLFFWLGRTIPKLTLAMGATIIVQTVLNICSLALRQIIIAEPINVPAVIAKWPEDIRPEEVYRLYQQWISNSGRYAASVMVVTGIKLVLFLVRGALIYLHWAARHQPIGTAGSNDENTIIMEERIQVHQGGQSDRTGPLASLFEAHEELRARVPPYWTVYEE